MKYYLNEGFILNETPEIKHKFILKEADDTVNADVENIKTSIKNLQDILNSSEVENNKQLSLFSDQQAENLKNDKDAFVKKINNYKLDIPGNWDDIINDVNQYLKDFYEIFPETKINSYSNLKDAIANLNNSLEGEKTANTVPGYKRIYELFMPFNKVVDIILKDDSKNKTAKNVKNILEELKTTINSVSKKLDSDAIKNTNNSLKNISTAATNIEKNAAALKDQNTDLSKTLPTLLEATKKLSADLDSTVNAKAEPNKETEKEANTEDTNKYIGNEWAERYRNISKGEQTDKWGKYNYPDATAFWNDYYNKAWGKNAENIKNTSEAFRQECLNFGFTKELNPFIDFLIGKDNNYKMAGINWNINNYGALHNSFVEGNINKKDLRGEGLLGSDNLIFKPFLYNINSADTIIEYLRLQKKVIDKKKNGIALTNSELANSYADDWNGKKTTELADFINKLFINNDTLKPISQIKQDIAVLFGDDESAKKVADKNDFKEIAATLGDSLNEEQKKALNLWLILAYANANAAKKYMETKENTTAINNIPANISTFKNKINNLPYTINTENVSGIVNAIKSTIKK